MSSRLFLLPTTLLLPNLTLTSHNCLGLRGILMGGRRVCRLDTARAVDLVCRWGWRLRGWWWWLWLG